MSLFTADYLLSKFPAIFRCWKKDLQKLILSLRKDLMCCEYINSWDRYTKASLPHKEKFSRTLKIKATSHGDYKHVQIEYYKHSLKNLNDVYCIENGKQLNDAEENFTISMHSCFKLDPLFFLTLASLSWEDAIKATRIELELLPDVNKILFCEKRY